MLDTVSIGIISYNEEKYINLLLDQILKQNYDLKKVELLFADGLSEDKTLEIINYFKLKNESKFKKITVLENKKRVQPSGWKIIVDNFSCDILIRLDAHSRIDENFISNNVKCINSGEYICGGPRENIIDEDSDDLLLIAEKSMFGSGIAKYRNEIKEKNYVRTVAHACYRKEVFEKIGNFNELLIRSEDNEIHYRARKNGYNICMDPDIKSQYVTRSTFKKMLKQKYGNGKWIGITSMSITPKIFSIYHFVPLLFVLSIIMTMLFGIVGSSINNHYFWIAFAVLMITYFLVISLLSILTCKKYNKVKYILKLTFLFFMLHISYGVGILLGTLDIKNIIKVKKYRKQ